MNDKMKVALKWGAIGGVAAATLGLIFYILNLDSDSKLNYLSFAILIGVVIAGSYEFRDKLSGGFANFKSLLGFGMLIILVYALISSLWAVVYMKFIDTNLVNEILLKTELDMEAKGLDDEIIDQTLAVTKKMMKPLIFFFTSFLSLNFFGLLITLLTSAVLKKEKPEDLIIEEKIAE